MTEEPVKATHLVDVLIPTHNYGRYIGECLASVAAQTFKSYKIFVQDNASTDDTEAVVRHWQQRLDICYEKNEANLGGPRNHELLTAKASAKYRIYLHADDAIAPDFLDKTVAALEDNPQCALAYTDWEMILDGSKQAIDMAVPFRGDGSGIHRDDVALLWNNYVTPSFVLIRASVMPSPIQCSGMEMLCDHLFAFHMAARSSLFFVDERLGKYRKHGSSETDRLFRSGKAMDELCVFYSRIYTTFEYGVPLRLLAKLCEVAKLHGWGLCETYRSLAGDSSYLSKWIAEQRPEIIPLIVRLVFAWPMLALEKRDAMSMLRELGWERPGIVPDDLATKIGRDPLVRADGLKLPAGMTVREIDGEHFARRMHSQWQTRPRFTFLADGVDAIAATQASLADQLYGSWQVIECSAEANGPTRALESSGTLGPDDWVILAPPGTRPAPIALFALADAINRKPQWQVIYADDATAWCSPRFKPDFDATLLAGCDYLGVVAVSAQVLDALAAGASLAPGLPYVLAWQVVGTLGEAVIGHLPQCLFLLPERFGGASRSLRRACVSAHFERLGHELAWQEGRLSDSDWALPAHDAALPAVTLIMPGGTEQELEAIVAGTRYPELRLCGTGAAPDAVSDALAACDTDLVLLLMPGLRPSDPQWLQTLVDSLMGWSAAAVGPAVLGDDEALADAGLVLGIGGSIGPKYPGARFGSPGDFMGRAALPHRVAALSGQCLLISREALSAAGGLDASYASLSGCLADACLRLHRARRTLIWTPAAALNRVSPQHAEPQEAPERFVDRHLANLANDPYWNRNLSLTTGLNVVETDLVPRWEPACRDVLRVLALPMPPSGQAEYRVTAPLRMLDGLGMAQVTMACEPHAGRERAPTPVELERMSPDVLYAQAAFDDVRLKGLLAAARHNPALLRVFSLDDRVSDIPAYNPSMKDFPRTTVIERMKLALASCQRLVVSTPPLAELYRHEIEDIRVVPNRLERSLWQTAVQPRRRVGKKPRVGWAGALQHEGDLAIIVPVVEALAGEVEWVFFGMIPKGCERFTAEYHAPVRPYSSYPSKLASLNLDLALAPLEINLFNEAKSNLRLIEYGFFGWPVVASDILPYRENDAPVTRVASRPADWTAAIREHLHDPDESERRGRQLSDWVQANYMLEDHPQDWLSALTP